MVASLDRVVTCPDTVAAAYQRRTPLIGPARRIGALVLIAGLFVAACSGNPAASSGTGGGSGAAGCVSGSITAAGSTALQPLVDKAAKDYTAKCSGARAH